jgi:hypothetical protein
VHVNEDLTAVIERAVRAAVEAGGLRAAPAAPLDRDALLSRKATAAALTALGYRTADKTLSTLASRGGGPPFHRYGAHVLYRWGPTLDWARSRLTSPRRSSAEADRVEGKADAFPKEVV